MQAVLIFAWIYASMAAMAMWESTSEGRNAWDKHKRGWKVRIGGFTLTAYHFYLFVVMWPILITLPFAAFGFDSRVFGIILSAFFSGLILEDLLWYAVNPEVRFREIFTSFSDYHPWLRIKGKRVIPWIYVLGIALSLLSWAFLWG